MDGIRFDIAKPAGPLGGPANEGAGTADGAAFSEALAQAVKSVEQTQLAADAQVQRVAAGEGNLHEMALSLEKADVSMRVLLKARNKLIDAYNDVMRMGI